MSDTAVSEITMKDTARSDTARSNTVWLQHNRVKLALHLLKDGSGDSSGHGTATPLLILHGLGEQTQIPAEPWGQWSGPIWGLDFTGHGLSDVPSGGGYTAEVLMSDADMALAHIGPATIYGRGVGAYIALLVAGARPNLTKGVVLTDGSGLTGGGEGPQSSTWFLPADADGRSPDPYALYELSNDVRPSDYAIGFLHLLLNSSDLDVPLVVAAKNRPPWLAALAKDPAVICETLDEAFERYKPVSPSAKP